MRRVTVPKYAFLDHKVLDASLQQHYGDGPIEDLWLPFYAVAADLSSMALTEIRTGPLWEAVRASSAIPGILPPFFTSDGRMLVDGGCIDNMPFRSMHRLKTGPNVVVNVQKETGKVYNVDYESLPGRAELLKRSVMPFTKGAPRAPGLISTVMRSLLVGQSDMLQGAFAQRHDDPAPRPQRCRVPRVVAAQIVLRDGLQTCDRGLHGGAGSGLIRRCWGAAGGDRKAV
jgi:NTE family protein